MELSSDRGRKIRRNNDAQQTFSMLHFEKIVTAQGGDIVGAAACPCPRGQPRRLPEGVHVDGAGAGRDKPLPLRNTPFLNSGNWKG